MGQLQRALFQSRAERRQPLQAMQRPLLLILLQAPRMSTPSMRLETSCLLCQRQLLLR